jgi:hypothetical protein
MWRCFSFISLLSWWEKLEPLMQPTGHPQKPWVRNTDGMTNSREIPKYSQWNVPHCNIVHHKWYALSWDWSWSSEVRSRRPRVWGVAGPVITSYTTPCDCWRLIAQDSAQHTDYPGWSVCMSTSAQKKVYSPLKSRSETAVQRREFRHSLTQGIVQEGQNICPWVSIQEHFQTTL